MSDFVHLVIMTSHHAIPFPCPRQYADDIINHWLEKRNIILYGADTPAKRSGASDWLQDGTLTLFGDGGKVVAAFPVYEVVGIHLREIADTPREALVKELKRMTDATIRQVNDQGDDWWRKEGEDE